MTDYNIKAVACLRGTIVSGLNYDAEIYTGVDQYVIKTGLTTREEALAIAQPIADELNYLLAVLIADRLKSYPKAKP